MAEQAAVPVLPLARAGAILRSKGALWPALAAAAIVVIVGGILANAWINARYGPEGTALSYLDALSRGDADTAWSIGVVLAPSALAKPDVALLDKNALRHQLATAANRPPSGWAVTQQQSTQLGAWVSVAHGGASQKIEVGTDGSKHFGLYPGWRVAVEPGLVNIVTAKNEPVAIDGIDLGSGVHKVALLPGRHQITVPATVLSGSTSKSVEVVPATLDQYQSIDMRPSLSQAGQQAAAAAIRQSLQACALSGWPYLGCPTALGSGDIEYAETFELVGDPAADATFSFDDSGQLTATGHVQVVIDAPDGAGGRRHDLAAGTYRADLTASDGSVTVGSFHDPEKDVPFAAPAGAASGAVLDALSKALSACGAATTVMPADCPNWYDPVVGRTSNVKWAFQGSPVDGAQVAFDPKTGAYKVSGRFSSTVSFHMSMTLLERDETLPIADSYEAIVIMDRGAPRVVTIQRMHGA